MFSLDFELKCAISATKKIINAYNTNRAVIEKD